MCDDTHTLILFLLVICKLSSLIWHLQAPVRTLTDVFKWRSHSFFFFSCSVATCAAPPLRCQITFISNTWILNVICSAGDKSRTWSCGRITGVWRGDRKPCSLQLVWMFLQSEAFCEQTAVITFPPHQQQLFVHFTTSQHSASQPHTPEPLDSLRISLKFTPPLLLQTNS